MDGKRTSVYLTPDLAAAVKASGLPLAELIRRGLGTAMPATDPHSAGFDAVAADMIAPGDMIKITADERMPPGVAALVGPDHDGKPQVRAFPVTAIPVVVSGPSVSGAGTLTAPARVIPAGTLQPGGTVSLSASGSYTAEPVAVSLADALKASLPAEREPVAVTETTARERYACCKHCKHTPSMRSHDRKCGQCP